MGGYTHINNDFKDCIVKKYNPYVLFIYDYMFRYIRDEKQVRIIKGTEYHLNPGQVTFSMLEMHRITGLDRKTIKRCIDILVKDDMITYNTNNQLSIVEIKHYKTARFSKTLKKETLQKIFRMDEDPDIIPKERKQKEIEKIEDDKETISQIQNLSEKASYFTLGTFPDADNMSLILGTLYSDTHELLFKKKLKDTY